MFKLVQKFILNHIIEQSSTLALLNYYNQPCGFPVYRKPVVPTSHQFSYCRLNMIYNMSPENVNCQWEKLFLEADTSHTFSHFIQVSSLMSSRQLLMPRNGRASVNAILQPAQSSAVMGTGYEHVRSGIKSTVPPAHFSVR